MRERDNLLRFRGRTSTLRAFFDLNRILTPPSPDLNIPGSI